MKRFKTFLVRKIQPDTWTAFQMLCVQEGISANDKIKELIEDYVFKGFPTIGKGLKIEKRREEQ